MLGRLLLLLFVQHLDHLRRTMQQEQANKGDLQLQLTKSMQVRSVRCCRRCRCRCCPGSFF